MNRSLLFVLILLSGCASRQPFSIEDKRKSLTPYAELRLSARAVTVDRLGRTPTIRMGVSDYLRAHTALIVGAEEIADGDIEKNMTINAGPEGNSNNPTSQYHFDFKSLPNLENGHAALISHDGYFLTAAHVIESKAHRLIFSAMSIDGLENKINITTIRTVFVDRSNDIAIIKADLRSPFHFRLRESKPNIGETLFAGAHLKSGAASGVLEKTTRRRSAKIDDEHSKSFLRHVTTIPLRKGDSGSALIDTEGYLCGVGVMTLRPQMRSIGAMLEADVVNRIIEEDRESTKTLRKN